VIEMEFFVANLNNFFINIMYVVYISYLSTYNLYILEHYAYTGRILLRI